MIPRLPMDQKNGGSGGGAGRPQDSAQQCPPPPFLTAELHERQSGVDAKESAMCQQKG